MTDREISNAATIPIHEVRERRATCRTCKRPNNHAMSYGPAPEPEPLRETFKEVAAGFVVLVLWAAAFWLWASIGVAVRV